MKNKSPSVALIILNYNGLEANFLEDCLSSVEINNYAGKLQVVVVDNDSRDDSIGFVNKKYPNFKLIELKQNLGFAGGNNVGMNWALENNFDYIYLLNQDTIVEPDFITQAIIRASGHKNIGSVQSKLLLNNDRSRVNSHGNAIHFLGFGYAMGNGSLDQNVSDQDIPYASGAAVLYSASALKKVGLFAKELWMYHEDLDLGWRLRLAGFRNVLAAKSAVYHKYDFDRSVSKYYFMQRNRYLVTLQNYRLLSLILIMPAWVLSVLGLLFVSTVRGRLGSELRALSLFVNPRDWHIINKQRQRIKKIRKVNDKQVVKFFTGKIEAQAMNSPTVERLANLIFGLYWNLIKHLIIW
ncbi:hypothetical protein CL634_09225 [bacterium]|nr:hypothetical protein [bacterium]